MKILTSEIKQYIDTIIGDVHVDVNIEFWPSRPASETHEKLTIDEINARLSALAGEIRYEVQKIIDKKLSEEEEVNNK